METAQLHGILRLLDEPDSQRADELFKHFTNPAHLDDRDLANLIDRSRTELGDLDQATQLTIGFNLRKLSRLRSFDRWQRAVSGPHIELEQALLAIARAELWDSRYSDADVTSHLDHLARSVGEEIQGTPSSLATIVILRRVLYERYGLRGNEEDYYDPANSLLPRVLKRGLGIPISLTAVAMLVGRRLSLPIYGIAAPGHFLGYVGDPLAGDGRFFDAFAGYQPLSPQASDGLHQRLPGDVLLPVTDRGLLQRWLRNLSSAHESRGQEDMRLLFQQWEGTLMQELGQNQHEGEREE